MNSIYRDWRDYQEAVAAFFRERGCSASVEVRMQGARGSHKIDVSVTFRQHGIECRWVVECKLRKSNVIEASKRGTVITYMLKVTVLEEALLSFAEMMGIGLPTPMPLKKATGKGK